MARLQLCDYHNMVAILEKSENNVDFHPIVDFVEASPLRRARIAQSSALPPVADKIASPLRDVNEGEACPTDSGFIADWDRVNIAKTFTLPHDPAPRVTSLAAVEGSVQQTINELTAFCTSLQRQHSELLAKFQAQEVEIHRLKERVKLLEDREGVAAERSRDDAPIMGRNLDEGEVAAERVSDDTEEMATILTSMDVATVLASRAAEVPTGSGPIPTAGPPAVEVPTGSDVVPIASPTVFAISNVVTPYRRRKSKEVMVESDTLKKQKVQEQIDAQVARELEEQLEREDQRRSEQIARDAEIIRIHAEEELQIIIDGLDRNNDTIAKYLQEYHQFASELPLERRIELINDSVRYQDNYAKEVAEEVNSPDEVSKEKVKEMMQLVPIEEVYVKALHHLDREDLNQLWRLVKETLNNRPPTSDKEMELYVELSRIYEPDDEDQLWTHTQNLMHAPVEWKLYDSCGVHHVTAKDKEIFMIDIIVVILRHNGGNAYAIKNLLSSCICIGFNDLRVDKRKASMVCVVVVDSVSVNDLY
nr:hypothetical protein [Tanacetum cinerariifolium]